MLPLLAIGAAASLGGAIYNGIHGNPEEDAYKKAQAEEMMRVKNRQAPQAGAANQSGLSGFRNNQQDLMNRLDAMSRGQGPSLAAEQMKAATDRNQASQASMANSGRGGGIAALNAANNMGLQGAQNAQQSMMGRIGEEQMANSQLGNVINQGRQGDEQNSQFNAQQQNFRDQANLTAKLQTMGYNDEQIRAMLQQQQAQANKPGFGDQLMSGGAGLMSMGASMFKGGK